MIVAGTYPPINIDLGKDEPGMILQREYRERGYLVWRDYLKDGKPVTGVFFYYWLRRSRGFPSACLSLVLSSLSQLFGLFIVCRLANLYMA